MRTDESPVEWQIVDRLAPYPDTLDAMKVRAAGIAEGSATESVWLLEHPPLYTAGVSAKAGDLLACIAYRLFRHPAKCMIR